MQLTPGMAKSKYPGRYKADKSKKCGCGFITPTYPGKYPEICPSCGGSKVMMSLAQEVLNLIGESLIDRLDKFAGFKIKPGRNVIKGYPVDITDSDGQYIFISAVDQDVKKNLIKILRSGGFKIEDQKGSSNTFTLS